MAADRRTMASGWRSASVRSVAAPTVASGSRSASTSAGAAPPPLRPSASAALSRTHHASEPSAAVSGSTLWGEPMPSSTLASDLSDPGAFPDAWDTATMGAIASGPIAPE